VKTSRPKVLLDKAMLEWINKHYSYRLKAENHLNKECFSDPDLNLHCCCISAKLPGGSSCKCEHLPGRVCEITCLVHDFCLAVYAYRLGIGGDDPKVAIKANLKLKYHKLIDKVQAILLAMSGEEGSESTRIMTGKEIDAKIPSQGEIEKMEKSATPLEADKVPLVDGVVFEEEDIPPVEEVTPVEVIDDDPLLSIKDAANLYGCTYANIATKVKNKVIPVVMVGNKKKVLRSDVFKAKQRKGKRGRPRKKKVVDSE